MYASQLVEKYKRIVPYYNGGKDLCVLAHKKKLITLGEIRKTGFYTCLTFYKLFTEYLNDGYLFTDNMILTRDYVFEMYDKFVNSLSIQQLRKQMLIIDTDDIFRVWKQIDIIDICGAGYHFNYIDFDMPDYDYLSAVNKIACANEYNFNYF